MITITATKVDGQIIIDAGQQALLDLFLQHRVTDNDKIFITYEVETDDHSYAQVSKVHASIRELAVYTGEDFEKMKENVKIEMGLFEPGNDKLKSFGDYSKKELSEAIRIVVKWGDMVGLNLS